MTKIGFLTLLTVVALLVVPVTALAQPIPPHQFTGTVTLDGKAAPDGTSVEAVIDGATVATASTSGGKYALRVVQPDGAVYTGKTVSFKVRTVLAAETAKWTMGELTTLNLTAVTATPTPAAPTPTPTPKLPPTGEPNLPYLIMALGLVGVTLTLAGMVAFRRLNA